TVAAHSAGPDQGSEFVVRLPAVDRPAAARPQAAAADVSPREILVIEDHEDSRASLTSLLESMGHRVVVAADGASGLDKALSMSPDVALGSRITGKGLFRPRRIRARAKIGEFEGERVAIGEARRRARGRRIVAIVELDRLALDATRIRRGFRFINHSCEPNTFMRCTP